MVIKAIMNMAALLAGRSLPDLGMNLPLVIREVPKSTEEEALRLYSSPGLKRNEFSREGHRDYMRGQGTWTSTDEIRWRRWHKTPADPVTEEEKG